MSLQRVIISSSSCEGEMTLQSTSELLPLFIHITRAIVNISTTNLEIFGDNIQFYFSIIQKEMFSKNSAFCLFFFSSKLSAPLQLIIGKVSLGL